jgi:hypothetical protein
MYKYNPTSTELRHAFETAYGDNGVYQLIGAMFVHMKPEDIEAMYYNALTQVRKDLEEKGLL